jgi:HEAT repeat protein
VEIRTILLDPKIRGAVQNQLEHSDTEVRRAAFQVLQHTLLFEASSRRDGDPVDMGDIRQAFLKGLDKDSNESIRAEAGRALAEWMSIAPDESAGFSEVVQTILRKSFEAEEDQVRFRTLQGLKQTALPPDDLDRVFDRVTKAGDFESRSWALELAAAHHEKLSADRVKSMMALAANDPDAKIRESVLHQMAHLPASDEAAELARHCLADREWNVRFAAVKALANYPRNDATLEALIRIQQADDNEDVRNAARSALERLK